MICWYYSKLLIFGQEMGWILVVYMGISILAITQPFLDIIDENLKYQDTLIYRLYLRNLGLKPPPPNKNKEISKGLAILVCT